VSQALKAEAKPTSRQAAASALAPNCRRQLGRHWQPPAP
jgi:hypothetical protein